MPTPAISEALAILARHAGDGRVACQCLVCLGARAALARALQSRLAS